jgi:hypothetical protein
MSETLIYATYYAPRGRRRLFALGQQLAQRYLLATDLLIGIIGAEGSGKSTLIRGMFPGLELTNDDDGVNVRPTPLYDFDENDYFSPHTFHIDVRYELAFSQTFQIVEAIQKAVSCGRRVIVEHFDLLYDTLRYNAQVLLGIGEEIIVARPGIFGPYPTAIKSVVDKTIVFRRMAHSAEDITSYILDAEYGYSTQLNHSDVRHGFVMNFPDEPEFEIATLEARVRELIEENLPIKQNGSNQIRLGEIDLPCTGTRTHVASTGEIKNFRLQKEFHYDQLHREYLLVGMVGKREPAGFEEIAETLE